jgi:hypothetical protein
MTDGRISAPPLRVPRLPETPVQRECREAWNAAWLEWKLTQFRGEVRQKDPPSLLYLEWARRERAAP